MALDELKARQSQVWGSGAYEEIEEQAAPAYDDLVSALDPTPGERFLDVACGTGAIARRAARAGAVVTGLDFAQPMLDTARRLAGDEGLDVRFDHGDAEALPYADASFDVVASNWGVMFAPDPMRAAAELARVCRPGGRLGLSTWDAEGTSAEIFALSARFAPPLPDGVPAPVDWGRDEVVRERLERWFDLTIRRGDLRLEGRSGEDVWQLFSRAVGPLKALSESLDPERRAEYHQAFVDLHERFRVGDRIEMQRQYVVTIGVRR